MRVRESLETYDAEEAKEKAMLRIRELVANGVQQRYSVEDYLTQYRKWADAHKTKRTRHNEEVIIKRFLDFTKVKSLQDITVEMIEMFLLAQREGRSSYTVRGYLLLLRVIFAPAVRWGRVALDPFKLVPLPKLKIEEGDFNAHPDRILSVAELQKITNDLTKRKDKYSDAILALMWTGMRRSELVRLHMSQVDFERNAIILHPQRTKTRTERVIPMLKIVREIMLRQTEPFPFGWLSNYPNAVSNAFYRSSKRAGVPGVTLKDLRGTFEMNLITHGKIHPKLAAMILGHTESIAARHYLGMDSNSVIQSAAALDSLTP